jgi:hypothetical protein
VNVRQVEAAIPGNPLTIISIEEIV